MGPKSACPALDPEHQFHPASHSAFTPTTANYSALASTAAKLKFPTKIKPVILCYCTEQCPSLEQYSSD